MNEERILKAMKELKEQYGACALKLGTEAENNSFEDIYRVKKMSEGILPVIVKIGGCEARNDMRTVAEIGVGGVIGPMIESSYAVRIFIDALRELSGFMYKKMRKIINIETITGYRALEEILNEPAFDELDQVTIGRTDYSSSLKLNVDDDRIFENIRDITARVHAAGKLVSVGGSITPVSAVRIKNEVMPDKVNIRTVVLDLHKCRDIHEGIVKSLEFEILLLDFQKNYRTDIESLDKRADVIRRRMCVMA